MAIVTSTSYQNSTNQTFTGSALASLTAICAGIDAAIRRAIWPFIPEPTTFTDRILNAPPKNILRLGVYPVRSITSLYLKWGANGESAEFTSDDLLTVYDDYYFPIDDPVNNYSRSGIVYRRGASLWAYEFRRELGRLSNTVDPNHGAVKATFAAGPVSVPEDLVQAAMLAVSKILQSRTLGTQVTSASLNGASYSLPAGATAGIFADPTMIQLLAPYQTVGIG